MGTEAAAAARHGWPAQLLAAPVDPSVPDVSDWSVAQVTAYLSRNGFGEHVPVFEKQVSAAGRRKMCL